MTSIIRRLAEKIMSSNAEEPPAKRQKRLVGASDRITVDVGGTKFITSVSTLTSNSEYFASLLSGNWAESSDNEIFLDRNPSAFGKIIEYMREGMIKVDDIDESVLTLAEFLGIERLILAIKIRWYHNIGRGPVHHAVHSTDEETATAFDEKYGGIMKAISAGLFQYFLKQDNVNADKDYAILRISESRQGWNLYKVEEVGKPVPEHSAIGILGALNGLHHKGYTVHETQLDQSTGVKKFIFSRRSHCRESSDATDIFIPNDEEINRQEENGKVKQYGALIYYEDSVINAPAEFLEDESMRSDPFSSVIINQCERWLVNNRFVTREKEYEEMFESYFKELFPERASVKVFSRGIVY